MVNEIECPYCHKIMDKRGYNSHVRACESKEKIKQEEEAEALRIKEQTERNFMDNNTEDQEPKKEETDSKNPKTSLLMKAILLIVGGIVVVISLILMLISPKSKELKEPTLRDQQVNRRLRSR